MVGLFGFLAVVFLGPWVVAVLAYRKAAGVERRLDLLRRSLREAASGLRDREAPAPPPVLSPAREVLPPSPGNRPVDPGATPGPASVVATGPSRPPRPADWMGSPAPAAPPVDWEKFTGVKLMSWVGGFALFLGAIFFAKYSIDHGWMTPAMRTVTGLLVGTAAIVLGLRLKTTYEVTAQTLAAAGAAILYAAAFAAHALYGFIGSGSALGFLSLVTVLAVLLAVRFDSRYIAVLGLVGGFLAPPLLSTGVDRAFALFSYVSLLDLGLLAVALRRRWGFLWGMAAAATVLMQAGWAVKFFAPEKMPAAAAIFAGFPALFSAVQVMAARRGKSDGWTLHAAGAVPLASVLFGLYALGTGGLASAPLLPLAVLFMDDFFLAGLALKTREIQRYHAAAGGLVFIGLFSWTQRVLTPEILPQALAAYVLFGALHGAVAVGLHRRGAPRDVVVFSHLFPLVLLLPLLGLLLRETAAPLLLWPVVLVLNVVVLLAALATGFLWAILGALTLSFIVAEAWILGLPTIPLAGPLAVVAGFTVFFMGVGLYLLRRQPATEDGGQPQDVAWRWPERFNAHGPAMSGLLPFFLLAAAAARLRPGDPSALFAVGASLIFLLVGFARWGKENPGAQPLGAQPLGAQPLGAQPLGAQPLGALSLGALPLAALGGAALLEYVWRGAAFTPDRVFTALGWHMGFSVFFLVLPFIARRSWGEQTLPWFAAAFAAPVHFPLLHHCWRVGMGPAFIGLLPGLLAGIHLGALAAVGRRVQDERRNTLRALFGGVALFFISLIFPVQFEKQWITLGWALEGVALLWLHRRVPHEGLKIWAFGLLALAFARLALNPAVFSYHPRTGTPLFNWYLYAYGLAAFCLFAGARLWRPAGQKWAGILPPRSVLNVLGGVLLFFLMNIEIADGFSVGPSLAFDFSGNLVQDMTYTLAWGLFGFGLLLIGLGTESPPARWASFGLLGLAVGKLFLHDVWRLPLLYRAAAFGGLAVVLIAASFFFQKHMGDRWGGKTP